MGMDRFQTKIVHEIDAFQLDELIAETYGLDAFECTLESPNDSTHSFTVKKTENQYPHSTPENKEMLLKYHQAEVVGFIERGNCEHHSLGHILDDMCDKGVIEEGNYLISVCW